jgi:hypothetical protein
MPSKKTPPREPVLSVVARKVGRAAGALTHMAETLVGKKRSQTAQSSVDETATKAASKSSVPPPKKTKLQTLVSGPPRRKARQKRKAAPAKKKAATKPRRPAKRTR